MALKGALSVIFTCLEQCGGVAFAALFWLIQTSDHRKIEVEITVELAVKLKSNWP